jgi:hypothetical protein
MKKGNLLLFILAIVLIVAMVLTFFLRGEKSRHGYGAFFPSIARQIVQTESPIYFYGSFVA